jgi:hypothetical protein
MQEHFVGRNIDLQSATDGADMIVVAELIDSGKADPGPPGQAYHYDVKIKVLRDLSGNVTGEHTITFSVQRVSEGIAEKTPVERETLIFFLQRRPDNSLNTIKILPATNENIQRLEGPKR